MISIALDLKTDHYLSVGLNSGLKESGIKAGLWTPFDFGLLHMHEK